MNKNVIVKDVCLIHGDHVQYNNYNIHGMNNINSECVFVGVVNNYCYFILPTDFVYNNYINKEDFFYQYTNPFDKFENLQYNFWCCSIFAFEYYFVKKIPPSEQELYFE